MLIMACLLRASPRHACHDEFIAVLSITSIKTWVCCKSPDIDLRYCSDSRYGGAFVCGCRFLMRCPSCSQILAARGAGRGVSGDSCKYQHVRLNAITAVLRVIFPR